MDITHVGNVSLRIKGKTATVVTNPDTSVRISDRAEGNPYVVDGPGEYEVKGVGIIGFSTGKSTVYRIEIDGVSIVYLGHLDRTLTASEVDSLDGVDILVVPVVGAMPIVQEVEPSIVIPIQYGAGELTAFLKEIGKEDIQPQPKLSITKDKIPEQMQVVVLE